MGLLSLLGASLMPILQVLILCVLGAFMATDYLKLFPLTARRSLNRIVFSVFTPALVFSSLAKTVRLQDLISWWFMPVNIGITFLLGGTLGWIAVKIIKPQPYLQYLVIAMCATGNLGNIMVVLIPAMCEEDGNPFGDKARCRSIGLSYASLSMALGCFYMWTYTYHLIQNSKVTYRAMFPDAVQVEDEENASKEPNKDLEASHTTLLLNHQDTALPMRGTSHDLKMMQRGGVWKQMLGVSRQILDELKAPPVVAAIIGFVFGAVSWLRNLIIGDNAPLGVISDSLTIIGDATIPCINLILGGNLTQGFNKSKMSPKLGMVVIVVRYMLLPGMGIGVVKGAAYLGLLPADPLFQFVLMVQYTLPPAMNIGTMTQLVDVAQEECSVLFLWTYIAAAFALTAWSTVFMWTLS
ncbi:Auxin efflux carrier family protein [Perilla frutescens var. hirtella]|uniref:Auxin efflux carrier family protein n=1 Tax=Perilla frutescens var. hirtella TaxID=608512 RepID=A0AAD4JR24_PERFH|nr:Auxin efflux carrier family protein [Perilla frutescens var. hirtella]KAH6807988.1 Auxin efflux carrier family protein [Perilla frutescens var. frutescens]KAH6837585.1 Auxin efflux carrier family protein [Perilla frutescens var. hirtella]